MCAAEMAFEVGTLVAGKYRIVRPLGEGGMGTVYVATNERLHKEVALKVLSDAAAGSAEAADRFMREAIAASRVKHPGIVEIYDADVHEGQPWIAMELLSGESLGQRLERGTLPSPEALDVVIEALSVLEPVHAAGIVHRDLKPDNLFLDLQADGRRVVKVLDFGIAKIHGGELGNTTRTGMAMGTPFFLAPEQARNAKETDERADLYAIGVILYHSLTLALPYEAESFGDLVAQMFTAGPRPLGQIAPSLPAYLCQIVDRCLAVDRSARPASARALREELAAVRGGLAAASPFASASPAPVASGPGLAPPAASAMHAPAPAPSFARSGTAAVAPTDLPYTAPPRAEAVAAAPRSAPIWPWALAALVLVALLAIGGAATALFLVGDASSPPVAGAPTDTPPPGSAPAVDPIPVEPPPAPAPVAVPEVPPPTAPSAPTDAVPAGGDAEAEARACEGRGDDDCVIRLLEGRDNSQSAHVMLIESYRAQGRTTDALRHMRTYVERYPSDRRAGSYREILRLHGEEPVPAPGADDAEAAAEPCVARGDHACVIRALEGRARSPRALEFLIEAYRAQGRTQDAHRQMEQFVRRYPSHPRASAYREALRGAAADPAPAPPVRRVRPRPRATSGGSYGGSYGGAPSRPY